MALATAPMSDVGTGAFPALLLVQGITSRTLALDHSPFTVGRRNRGKDLVISDPKVSRDHAVILFENDEFFVVDQGSAQGTFVNGERVQRAKLQANDRLEFGVRDAAYVVFQPQHRGLSTARDLLHHISDPQMSDLEKLTLFLDAARELNTTRVLDEVLVTLIDSTLRLSGAERGYVFLCQEGAMLRLAAGRKSSGTPLLDDQTISHSILEEAINSNAEFLVSDTSQSSDLSARNSIVAHDLRSLICIPLRKTQVSRGDGTGTPQVLGALYLDARYTSHTLSGVGQDVLRAIARQAAALVENARLVEAEEAARLPCILENSQRRDPFFVGTLSRNGIADVVDFLVAICAEQL